MDVTNDVILVFGMNGRVLHPDHGYVSVYFEYSRDRQLIVCIAPTDDDTGKDRRVVLPHSLF